MSTMLCIRQTHQASKQFATTANAMLGVYLSGYGEAACSHPSIDSGDSGSSIAVAGKEAGRSFAPVAQPRYLDWLGPGS